MHAWFKSLGYEDEDIKEVGSKKVQIEALL